MRIAFSGTLYSGKTSLIKALSEHMPEYQVFDEPYLLMEDEGHNFSNPPSVDEYEQQMERSLQVIEESPGDAFIDRCPLDYLAFAAAAGGDPTLNIEKWESEIKDTLARIDLIVFIPLESPDRIELPSAEDAGFREVVDKLLQELVSDFSSELLENTEVVEVTGSLDDRVRTVLRLVCTEAGVS